MVSNCRAKQKAFSASGTIYLAIRITHLTENILDLFDVSVPIIQAFKSSYIEHSIGGRHQYIHAKLISFPVRDEF